MTVYRSLMVCIVVGSAGAGWSEVVPWLYDGDVVVASQSDTERRRAASAALAEVLTRLTGMREIPFGPVVDDAIEQSERYYVRYGFANRDIEQPPGEDPVTETRLQVRFESSPLLALARRAGLPVWSADRPSVLAWVVHEREAAREVVSDTAAGVVREVATAMWDGNRRRGIRVFLPLRDLDDRGLRVADLRGRFWDVIATASRRYAADLLLLGRIVEHHDGRCTTDWELRFQAGLREFAPKFELDASSAQSAVEEAVHWVADAMAARFAVRAGDLDTIAVTVRGAHTVLGYASVLRYLQSREYIDRVEVSALDADALQLRLHSSSGRDQLLELLLLGGSLSIAPGRSGSDGGSGAVQGLGLDLTWTGAR